MRFPPTSVLLLFVALSAHAAPGAGGGRGFLDDYDAVTPSWRNDLSAGLGGSKLILLYVHPLGETGTPSFLRHPDIARASRDAFVFVRIPFKSGDPTLKDMNITAAPTVLILDGFGNEWRRATALSQNGIKDLLRYVPEEIARYTETLDRSLAQAKSREDKDDDRGALLIYRRMAAETKKGFDQIVAAREKVRQLGNKRLRDAVAALDTGDRAAVQELETLIRENGETPLGTAARLALLVSGIEQASDLRTRIPEIQRIAGLTGEEYAAVAKEAQETLAALEAYGDCLIGHAIRKSKRGDTDTARGILRRVASDFPGTKAARQAGAELGKL